MHPKRAHGSNGSFLWTIVNVPRSSPNSRSPYLVHMAIDAYEHQNESWNNFLKEKCNLFIFLSMRTNLLRDLNPIPTVYWFLDIF